MLGLCDASTSVLAVVLECFKHSKGVCFERAPRTDENPAAYACWLNESDNKRICKMAAAAHRRVFEERVLAGWSYSQTAGTL